jgi:hypothetical protein
MNYASLNLTAQNQSWVQPHWKFQHKNKNWGYYYYIKDRRKEIN